MEVFRWNLSRPLVMGILNVTPDSFSDGGQYLEAATAVDRGRQMARAGADIIDIGGESTRPGSMPVSAEEELRRVLPVIERLAKELEGEPPGEPNRGAVRQEPRSPLAPPVAGKPPPPILSIDTTKAVVAERALAAGARIVNDISALRQDPDLVAVVRDFGAGVVLMHMQGTPATMQQNPRYPDVVREVWEFLAERIEFALAGGVKKSQIAVDPGLGFGKTVEHNRQLLAGLEQFATLGCPILVGASRKSFLGQWLNRPLSERGPGSLAAAAWAVAHGAQIVRAHDVAATVDVVRLIAAVQQKTN